MNSICSICSILTKASYIAQQSSNGMVYGSPNCVFWLDASVLSSVNYNLGTGAVNSWADISGNGMSFIPGASWMTAKGAPTYNTGTYPYLYFNNGGSGTVTASSIGLGTDTTSFLGKGPYTLKTFYIVCQTTNDGGGYHQVLRINNSTNYPTVGAVIDATTSGSKNGAFSFLANAASYKSILFDIAQPVNTKMIITLTSNSQFGFFMWTSNTTMFYDYANTYIPSNAANTGYYAQFCLSAGNDNRAWTGNIYEVLMYDGFQGSSERWATQNSLASKWGITLSTSKLYPTSFSPYTQPISNPITTIGIAISSDCTKIVGCTADSSGNLWFSTYSSGSWSAPSVWYTATSIPYFSIALKGDGSRGVVVCQSGGAYYFTWTSTTPDTPQSFDSTSRTYRGLDMTTDGSRIVAVVQNSYVYFSTWTGSTYSAFSATLDATGNYLGIGVTSDGSRIVYGVGTSNAKYADWNGSNYAAGTSFTTVGSGNWRNLKITSDANTVFGFRSLNQSYFYLWNGTTYSPYYAIPLTAIPTPSIDPWAVCMSANNNILIAVGSQSSNSMYQTTISY